MTKLHKIINLILFCLLVLSPVISVQAQTNTDSGFIINAVGPLTPSLVNYIERGIRYAERQNAELIVIALDTPGGSIDLMNKIVQDIRSSGIPIIVYVSPAGAIAGSAGTLITLAGHFAVMAPETAIGAASPVGAQGEEIGETMAAKQKEILKASVRSLASNRSEGAIRLAEDTIENAKAVSANEAYQVGLIDYVAADMDDLLSWLDGKEGETSSGEFVLSTKQMTLTPISMSFIEQLLQFLTNPNILFLLLTIGVQAIFIELSNPGGWVAGFIGAACLILAIYGLGILPVNWFGILFILLSFVLFVLEIKTPTLGGLTAAGVISFIVGSLVLFNNVESVGFPSISIPLVVTISLFLGAGVLAVLTFALKALKEPVKTGMEALIGISGYVVDDILHDRRGTVQVAGEQWSAVSLDGKSILKGDQIEVSGKEGITLVVQKK